MIINFLTARRIVVKETTEQKIAKMIQQANYSVWAMGVWFSNRMVFRQILEKLAEGVGVEVVLTPEEIKLYKDQLSVFIEKGGEVFCYKKDTAIGERFFVIDHNTIIGNTKQSNIRYMENHLTREYAETIAEHYIDKYLKTKKTRTYAKYRI